MRMTYNRGGFSRFLKRMEKLRQKQKEKIRKGQVSKFKKDADMFWHMWKTKQWKKVIQ
jgi:hypothetical protein